GGDAHQFGLGERRLYGAPDPHRRLRLRRHIECLALAPDGQAGALISRWRHDAATRIPSCSGAAFRAASKRFSRNKPLRYGLHFTPPASDPLTLAAQRWLGRNAFTGAPLVQPETNGLDAAALTADPRRYGFHATLKAPFALAEGRSEAELLAEIGRF